LVKGGVCLAKRFKISTLVVGLTIVSLGTSAPELFVSLSAALKGNPDIAIGNVIGSNISNIGLVLGLSALILPIAVRSSSVKFDWPVMMFSGILLLLFGLDGKLSRFEGFIFTSLLISFIVFLIVRSRKANMKSRTVREIYKFSLPGAIAIVLASSVGLMIGANQLVEGATKLAHNFNVSERAISISMIAIGTSLPELATSVVAAIRKETDISIGNIIGSNIYNTFGILGITSLVEPIQVNFEIMGYDMLWMLGFFLLLFVFILPIKGGIIYRYKGFIFLLLYIIFIYFVFVQ
jgi:cation:H+ antiporter